ALKTIVYTLSIPTLLCFYGNKLLDISFSVVCLPIFPIISTVLDLKMDVKNKISCDKKEQASHIVNKFNPDKNVTEEEFQNFMHRVTEVEKVVKKLASSDPKEQEYGQKLADEMLERKVQKEIYEDGEVKITTNRSIINKYASESNSCDDPNEMSREMFMKNMEDDAKKRYEDRKIRNERAETFKRIANGAFKEGDYEKAVTYFSKALEQRKDSSVLWNNRALSYMHLGLFEKALHDCEWVLKLNNSNLKALLNSVKCYMNLGNVEKSKEYIQIAKERNPHFNKFINEFEENLETEFNKFNIQVINDNEI
ncbi:tetratricopeptide repeat protein 12-like, partial [Nylanderia fulva]|uniref:tetratricopeptide repeat protein 12-like n=1 Tax=Nylanderia fulva TaxID=613905 RepID=UPI0010FB24B3